MSGRIRRQWTHRRLGLGTAVPSDAAMAYSDELLTAVGARRTPTSSDAFDVALFDFVCEIDLLGGVNEVDTTPIPAAALRCPPRRARRPSWRLTLPALGGALAAFVAVLMLLLAGGQTTTGTPALSATAESKQLLTHADLLLTAAEAADGDARSRLVTEAKADLKHVRRLLPLAPPPAQPAIRSQLQRLNARVAPMAPPPTRATSDGTPNDSDRTGSTRTPSSTTQSGFNSQGSTTPARRRPPARTTTSANDQPIQSEPRPPSEQSAAGSQSRPDGARLPPQGVPNGGGQRPPPEGAPPTSPRP